MITIFDDVSAGGTVNSSQIGATGALGLIQVVLHGSPGGEVIYVMPDVSFAGNFLNVTDQAIVLNVDGETTPQASINPGTGVTSSFLSYVPGVGGNNYFNYNDYDNPGQGSQAQSWGDIGTLGTNELLVFQIGGRGQCTSLPIFGTLLNPLDCATYFVTPVACDGAPIAIAGTTLQHIDGVGWMGQSTTGLSAVLVSDAIYPNTPWSTQAANIGGARPTTTGPAVGNPIGDSIVGQSTSTFTFAPIEGRSGFTTTRFSLVLQARVTASTNGIDTVGDRVTITQDFDFDYLNGAAVITRASPNLTTALIQTPTVLQSGADGTFTPIAGVYTLFLSITGTFSPSSVGNFINISGADESFNNGVFQIVGYSDPNSIYIYIPGATGVIEGNSGSLTWVEASAGTIGNMTVTLVAASPDITVTVDTTPCGSFDSSVQADYMIFTNGSMTT